MPPRKSNVSQISATGEDGTPAKEREGINIEDLSLPRTMVQRLAKGVLPANTSLHKDAILAMSKGATVFINYLAHAANTASLSGGKRTIPPTAVIEALAELEFESFGLRVEAELKKFNEVQTGKRNEYRRKVKEGKMGGLKGEEGGDEEEGGRAKKRVRREEGDEGVDEGDEGRERRESGTGDPSAQLQTGYREFENEDVDDEEENFDGGGEGEEEEEENAVDDGSRPRRVEEEEDEEEGEEEEEEEEEEDDEDEYPDEGRRLSSVERESFERHGDDALTPGSSVDEALSEDEGSD